MNQKARSTRIETSERFEASKDAAGFANTSNTPGENDYIDWFQKYRKSR